MIKRALDISKQGISVFLFGPRQVGKTSLIRSTLNPDIFIDLLNLEEYLRYSKNPGLLNKEVASLKKEGALIVIDEVQRYPLILNEVQSLIETPSRPRFILTGSSARTLKRKGTNLLGGRAVPLKLHPFTHEELSESFNLEAALRYGTLPPIAMDPDPTNKRLRLQGYVETYLKEEIQQEAAVRNIPAFSRFLDLAAFENGHVLNFSNLSREIGVDAKTIRAYFQILEDTLIGFFLPAYSGSMRKRLVLHPKFYFFDPGIVSALTKTLTQELIPGSPPFGDAFEHWSILETRRILDYRQREVDMAFFRTTDGAEVDLVLKHQETIWAIEFKSGDAPRSADLGGLRSFRKDHHADRVICVCQTPRRYVDGNIDFLPWREFMSEL